MENRKVIAIKAILILAAIGFIAFRAISVKPEPESDVTPQPTVKLAEGFGFAFSLEPEDSLPNTSLQVQAMAFSPDGQRLAVAHPGGAQVWDMNSGELLQTLGPAIERPNYAIALKFSPNGYRLAAGYWDATARVWDLATGREIAVFRGNALRVEKRVTRRGLDGQPLAFTPNGERLITALEDEDVTVWDIAAQRRVTVLEGQPDHPVYCITVSPDGNLLATNGRGKREFQINQFGAETEPGFMHTGLGDSHIWSLSDVGNANESIRFEDAGHATIPRSGGGYMAFSPDGKYLAKIYYDGRRHETGIGLWDTESFQLVHRLRCTLRDTPPAHDTVFAPDSLIFVQNGRQLMAAGSELTAESKYSSIVRTWDIESNKQVVEITFPELGSVAFSPDGKRIALPSRVYERHWNGWSMKTIWPIKSWRMNFMNSER